MVRINKLVVVAALTIFASSALADDVNIRSMDEPCRTDATLQGHCFIPPADHAVDMTLMEFAQELAMPFGDDPNRVMNQLIHYNQWHGASADTVIPAGTAFRIF